MTNPDIIVFTDLDGTLLDHRDYSWQAADPALQMMRDKGWPVILASSKTAAEIAPLRAEVGFDHCPAIVENGAGILPAGASPDNSADAYTRLRAALDSLPDQLRQKFKGFGDMSDAEVAQITGLPLPQATLARQRAFSDPGLFDGTEAEEDAFVAALSDLGLHARRGGRFLTLSWGGTKADRMDDILKTYGHPTSIALGDAPNDVEMLEKADHGVIITNPDGKPLPQLPGESAGCIRRSTKPGPAGWNAEVIALLSNLTTI
ncbi:HAD-IIB family hydrolase [Pseudooceanicola sp. MF1-13]|uniref:HAD-IIB family hydrolase n=1 Tax=Pseudooceanicola sp. MF1-13 TaxID=3379095 RepID=UPI003891C272